MQKVCNVVTQTCRNTTSEATRLAATRSVDMRRTFAKRAGMQALVLTARPMLVSLGLVPTLAWVQPAAGQPQNIDATKQVLALSLPAASSKPAQGQTAGLVQTSRMEVNYGKVSVPANDAGRLKVQLLLQDAQGAPLRGEQWVRMRISGVLGPAALRLTNQTSELAAATETPGVSTSLQAKTQKRDGEVDLLVKDGELNFELQAPATPGEVLLQFTHKNTRKEARYYFDPELRPLMLVGLLQGALYFSRAKDTALVQSRFNDGFERELMRFSKQFSDQGGYFSGSAAFYVKGAISGKTLLTASYDSDKETRARLLANVNPDSVYPVFGDDSTSGSDVRSTQRLYIRLDNGDNYALYGDFGAQGGATRSSSIALGGELKELGQYSRTLSGLQLHSEGAPQYGEAGRPPKRPGYSVTVYGARDTLRTVIEELRGQGISGPYAIANTHALQGSENVEIIVRDRNNLGHILSATPQQRVSDYAFEPFSGRLLFKQPVPSLDASGNPVSIRVRYEVDQGGDKFWVMGADVQVAPIKEVALGLSVVKDQNPYSPYDLRSAAVALQPLPALTLVGEIAQSHSLRYSKDGNITNMPQSGQDRNAGTTFSGQALRLEAKYALDGGRAYIKSTRTGTGFDNGFAPLQGGRSELSAGLEQRLGSTPWSINGWASETRQKDRTDQYQVTRRNWRVGSSWSQGGWAVGVGVQQGQEQGDSGLANNLSGQQSPGPTTQGGGGFFGTGSGVVNPSTGNASQDKGGTRIDTDYRAAYVNTEYKPSDKTRWFGEVMQGRGEDRQAESSHTVRRLQAGVEHELLPKLRVYARGEESWGWSSVFGASSKGQRYRVAGLGLARDIGEAGGAWEGRMFSEYRLDQRDVRSTQNVYGLRQTWRPNERWTFEGSAELVQSRATVTIPKAWALTTGVHYRDDIWHISNQLEYRRSLGVSASSSGGTSGRDGLKSYLHTLAVARKLNRNWTLLLKNYLLYNQNENQSGTPHFGASWQERLQIGAAWRDHQTGWMSHLFRYELKTEQDGSSKDKNRSLANILSWHSEYHPNRQWWINTRLAGKWTQDSVAGVKTDYRAYLAAGRVNYEVNDWLDLSPLGSLLYSPHGDARQYAIGAEAGFVLRENVRLGLGYNLRGFYDRDLSADNYTRPGLFTRLDMKF